MKRGWTVLLLLLWASIVGVGAARESSAPPAKEAVFETSDGTFVMRLLPEVAPQHVKFFVLNVQKGLYEKTIFHRIIRGGIIQGGDPLSKDPAKAAQYGQGGLGVLNAEFRNWPGIPI